ncbi:MAG: type VI secretion system baseplate subunit TssK, partial [Rhodospirillales bacterium]|nr:type VI secretion system baseplate subunit TssK [Rhodospirillales bacterium]
MSWTNRVIWQEGMFLRSQHFQQQDRWLEAYLRGRVAALRTHGWGLTQMSLDRDLLGTGRFAVSSASGVFDDGTPFSLPGETEHPAPFEVPENTRGILIHLALPVQQAGGIEIAAADGSAEGRYKAHSFEAY